MVHQTNIYDNLDVDQNTKAIDTIQMEFFNKIIEFASSYDPNYDIDRSYTNAFTNRKIGVGASSYAIFANYMIQHLYKNDPKFQNVDLSSYNENGNVFNLTAIRNKLAAQSSGRQLRSRK